MFDRGNRYTCKLPYANIEVSCWIILSKLLWIFCVLLETFLHTSYVYLAGHLGLSTWPFITTLYIIDITWWFKQTHCTLIIIIRILINYLLHIIGKVKENINWASLPLPHYEKCFLIHFITEITIRYSHITWMLIVIYLFNSEILYA